MRAASGVMPLMVMRAGGRLFEIGDDAQERGLAAARGADERDELALLDVEVDVAERDDVAVVGLEGEAQIFGGDDASQRTSPASSSTGGHGGERPDAASSVVDRMA